MNKLILIILTGLLLTNAALAEDKLGVNIIVGSYVKHFGSMFTNIEPSAELQEDFDNRALGVQYRGWSFVDYKNSFFESSQIIQKTWYFRDNGSDKLFVSAGIVSGYVGATDLVNYGKWIPALNGGMRFSLNETLDVDLVTFPSTLLENNGLGLILSYKL